MEFNGEEGASQGTGSLRALLQPRDAKATFATRLSHAGSSETLPKCALPAASSHLYRAGSSSADVQDSALRLTLRNFQNKPSGKKKKTANYSQAISLLHRAPPARRPRSQSHREGFERTESGAPKPGTEGARQ